MTTHECPKCGPVPDVELFGIEYPEVYDGVLFWAHQRCNTAWPPQCGLGSVGGCCQGAQREG